LGRALCETQRFGAVPANVGSREELDPTYELGEVNLSADLLKDYVPDVDATVVERILDAGGEIAVKAVCEYYCVSGGSKRSPDERSDIRVLPLHA
jgi:hypothetical protein